MGWWYFAGFMTGMGFAGILVGTGDYIASGEWKILLIGIFVLAMGIAAVIAEWRRKRELVAR